MNTSLFSEIVGKFFALVIGAITERFNDAAKEPALLNKTMLREEYSADLRWGSTTLNNSIVAADVVALNSSLPLKSRGKLDNAQGTVPKIAVKFRKDEKQITDINILIARGSDEKLVASKLFDDAVASVKSIEVRKEILFEEALSTGQVLVSDGSDTNTDNDGTGVRADFGYLDKNKFKALVAPWGTKVARPLDDVRQMFDEAQADGNVIRYVLISLKYFNYLRNSNQSKLLTATFEGQVITSIALLPTPSRRAFLEALKDEFGAEFRIVDSVFKVENPDGTTKNVRPWVEANVVGIPEEVVGRLVYGTLAEETNPVAAVEYQKAGTHILVSKYSSTDPLQEYTAGQSLCMPVIDGGNSIYLLQADEVKEGAITVEGEGLVDGTLSVAKEASKNTLTLNYTGDADLLSVESSETWCKVKKGEGTLVISVTANSETSAPAREATVTITDGYNTVEITVEQAANA